MRALRSLAVLSLSLVVAASTLAAQSGDARAPGDGARPLLDPRTCPELFGDDETRAALARWRAQRLGEIARASGVVTVIHGIAAWREAKVHRPQGVALVEVARVRVTGADGNATDTLAAVVDVTPAAFASGHACEPGLYALTVDDTIGDRGVVLHIDERTVLVELDGQPGYLLAPTMRAPRTRLVWRSSLDVDAGEPLFSRRTPKERAASRTITRVSSSSQPAPSSSVSP